MPIQMEPRRLFIPVLHIDANLINARQRFDAVNRLERWDSDGVILIVMSATAHAEANAGRDALRSRKANAQLFTATPPIERNDPDYRRVQAAMFPSGAADENERNDIRVVCEAAKYAAILVTADGASKTQPGGILGNRDKLLGFVQIMSPQEAVAFVERKVRERDEFNQRVAMESGIALPDWTGRD